MDLIDHGELAAAIAAGAALIAALSQGFPRPLEERARERAKAAAELTQMLPEGGPEQRIAWAVARDAVWVWGLAALPTAEEARWLRHAQILRIMGYGALGMAFVTIFTVADLGSGLGLIAWAFLAAAYGLVFASVWARRKARRHRRPSGVLPLERGGSNARAAGPGPSDAQDRSATPEGRAEEGNSPSVRPGAGGHG